MIGFIEKSIFPCIHGVLFLEIKKYYYSKKNEIFLLKKQLKVECNCKSVLHFKLHLSLSWPTTSYMPS